MGPRGQEPNESTDDAVWQDLVARLEGTAGDPGSPDLGRPAPQAEPADPLGTRSDERGGADTSRARGGEDLTDRERAEAIFRDQPLRATGPRDYPAALGADDPDDDEGFIPEEPPPLGSGDPLTVLAWVGAAGGPITLLLFAMFWRDAPLAATLGVLVLFLAGAGYLVTRLPKHRDIGDDGAEV